MGAVGAAADQLDTAGLAIGVREFAALGVADSTRRAYRTGEYHFARFCSQRGLTPLPASEQLLAGFCTALALEGKAYSTIKVAPWIGV